MNNFIEEFKTFAVKGNAIDLAVGIVIGTAFNNIVNSLVNDVIMQAIAMIFGQPDFSAITLGAIKLGSFINSIVNFVIIALSVFVAIKAMNKFLVKKPVEQVSLIK
jgi:large conductance mechanosensitive channel